MERQGRFLLAVLFLAAAIFSIAGLAAAGEDSGIPPGVGGEESGVPPGVGAPPSSGDLPGEVVGVPPNVGGLPGEEAGVPPNIGGLPGEEAGVPPNVGGCQETFLDNHRCSGNNRQREKQLSDCSKQWFTLETCPYGCQQVWASPTLPVTCNSPPGDGGDGGGGGGGGAGPVDSAPSATISVPASAAPSALMSISVAGTDDVDVAELVLYDAASAQLASFSCAGVQATCSNTFTVTAPATFSTSYTFKARSKDNAGQLSAFASGTGATTAAPAPAQAPAPAPVTVSTKLISKPSVSTRLLLRLPLQPLFLRSASFLDSDCVRPGESALLAVKVQNTGRSTLRDVSFTATVAELGIRARTGPHSITRADRSSKFMQLAVPADAEEGSYFLRLSVTNNKFSKVVHRAFNVDGSC